MGREGHGDSCLWIRDKFKYQISMVQNLRSGLDTGPTYNVAARCPTSK